MRFLVDAQLPPFLAYWLREQGFQSDHVEGLGLRDADDTSIWKRAEEIGAVLVTKDEDFALRSARSQSGPKVVWLRARFAIEAYPFFAEKWKQETQQLKTYSQTRSEVYSDVIEDVLSLRFAYHSFAVDAHFQDLLSQCCGFELPVIQIELSCYSNLLKGVRFYSKVSS